MFNKICVPEKYNFAQKCLIDLGVSYFCGRKCTSFYFPKTIYTFFSKNQIISADVLILERLLSRIPNNAQVCGLSFIVDICVFEFGERSFCWLSFDQDNRRTITVWIGYESSEIFEFRFVEHWWGMF